MKITLKNQTIELSDEDLKKHGLQRIEKKGEFEVGGKFWCIDVKGVSESTWDGDVFDKARLEAGNAFHTKSEAENHLAWLKARARIVRRIKELNDGWEPDWDNIKYNIYYDNQDECLDFVSTNHYQEQPQEMYLKSEVLAKQLIKELEPELEIYLGVK